MGNVARRPDGRWRARYRDAANKEHARHFSRKIDAQHWLDSVTTAVQTGSYIDPGQSRICFEQWADRWLSSKVDLTETTHATYDLLLRKHILPAWGPVKLSDITHEAVASWASGLANSGLAASTVRQTHRVFSMALDHAVRDGRLARNPASRVPVPRAAKASQRYLTHDQVAALADAAGRDRLPVLFLAYTGARFGEMAALKVRNLDLLRRRAHIVEAAAEVGGRVVISTPKTHQHRSVPIPRFLADELAGQVDGKSADQLVFTSPRGTILRNRNWRGGSFGRAAKATGLAGLTPHGLRHTAASLAIASGANVKVVQQMLGHDDPRPVRPPLR